ncbi:stabilin-2 [Ahaetulla prasina]|uniref:stabilin-2 n=1 Tax=Ahaetulla prasina TaxID=499056 RepID=UPI0026487FB4|nr:stabilin-2 [Ahaetulla prasina]
MRKQLPLAILLSFVMTNAISLVESTQQERQRCDEDTVFTTKTKCGACSVNYKIQCPEGYSKITKGSGRRGCRYQYEISSLSLSFNGCQHTCMRKFQQPQCCAGYWGQDCLECPGGPSSPCSNRGHCFQGIWGNGTCACQKAFAGTACEKCAEDNVFGPNCTSVCSCIHGICNNGLTGDGQCLCLSGYKGLHCDQPIPECEALQCPEYSRCSVSSVDKSQLECKCLPSYEGDGKQCKPINPCSKMVCDPHADCLYLGPNRHNCTCQYGYEGDGQVCVPINPCQKNFGNCPIDSTICKYDGPGKSHCECKEHFRNFVPGRGCSMKDICATNNPCHKNAVCTMTAPGQTLCTCQKGYVGDGFVCYGNIMDQIKEMNNEPGGYWQGSLISAIELFESAYEWPLTSLGPFTILLPINKGFNGINIKELLSDKDGTQYFVKLHIFAGQISLDEQNVTRTVYTLTGKPADIFKDETENTLRIRIQGGKKKGKILQGNIAASNGIIHIIDTALDNMEPAFKSDKEKSVMAILQDKPRFSRFRSMVENTFLGTMLDKHSGPNTVFIPTNDALENLKENTLDYLSTNEGSRKLLELIQYHIVSHTQLEVASLISIGHIKTLAQQFIYFNFTENGQVLVNGKKIEEADIAAKNGRIYTLSDVLIPPSIIPILPHRCDKEISELKLGTCGKCTLHRNRCPENSLPVALLSRKCLYQDSFLMKYGCAQYCNVTKKEPECCKGFFGSECNQCPGGFLNPCSGNGQCMDGMKGNGTCICKSGFERSQCQFCTDPNKYGPQCKKECMCVHGKCDNQIDGDGSCLPGSCKSGYAGDLCDTQVMPCGPFFQLCDVHADCILSNGTMSCVCKPGFEGDGIICSEVNPCAHINPHSCSANAECIKTGPGTHECVCQPGWTGNGRDCSEINNCLLSTFGGCHTNATCHYVGPGQNDCECKEGFRGNGYECEPINYCLEQNWKCHPLAVCQLTTSGVWKCVCSRGYEGDGSICYGNIMDELTSLSGTAGFNEWFNTAAIRTLLRDMSNITILVPSHQAIQNLDQYTAAFWTSQNNILFLTKCHILNGIYRVEDLQTLSQSNGFARTLQDNFLTLSERNGNVLIDGANIISGDIAATNGIIHIIDKVLAPLRGLSGSLPKLLPRLEQMPDYSIFRNYIIHYNLANVIEAARAYSVFAPSNKAIESYLKEKQSASLDEDQIRYHIILGEKLLKNDLHIGMFKTTMLGLSFRVGFFSHDNQLYINEAPINYPNVATDKGIIHGLGSVMEIVKNRCDINDTVIVNGRCVPCSQISTCPTGSIKIPGKKGICYYVSVYGIAMRVGCQSKCTKSRITRECCAGFYGPQCESCPGLSGKICFGNGFCLDGINGTGSCQCEAGFDGVACERCSEGKYGTNCDQDCACINGRCNSGIKGDGTCECNVGWRGVKCDSEIRDDNCNNTCHTSANCFLNPIGPTYCKCAAGFKGNGTYCSAINACENNNGGCSAKAECRRTTPGKRVCACRTGYSGDGIACFEINPCLEKNGGCAKNAECTHTGPNKAVCNCFNGYSGDGKTCTFISPCTVNNGGCGENAICNDTLSSERTCICKPNYIGDGFLCRGSISLELSKEFNTTRFGGKIMDASLRDITGTGPFTVFAPTNEALLTELQLSNWVSRGVLPQILRYHIVSCTGLLYNDLTSDKTVITLHGEPLKITFAQNTVFLNGKAKILTSDIITTNGVIHIIDKVLAPQKTQEFPFEKGKPIKENLKTVAANNEHIMFYNLIEKSGLINLINDPLHQPVTLFWPTDKVIRALPKEQQDELFKMSNKEKLLQYLKFHVIGNAKILAYALPSSDSLKTLQGSDLSVKCGDDDTNTGELFLNERRCKIIQRHLEFDGGIAYGIDCMLTDPILGGRCDTFMTTEFPGDCVNCFRNYQCPGGSKITGDKQQCEYTIGHRTLSGCRKSCSLAMRIPQCCKGYFGNKCQACPGGPEAPCNNHGYCDEGYAGTGECVCNAGFNGTSCELCMPGRYGLECRTCDCTAHGQCDEGISGSGHCFCETGWTGRLCETELASTPVCSPSCSVNAVCSDDGTCQCKPYYTGDGLTCTAEKLCKKSNGGCHKNAKCVQTDVKVNCTCQKGYQGDGYTCMAINPCTDGFNGGCHEHALCTMTGPDKRKCECKENYIGDGIDCEVSQLPIDRCLQNNGQCHADAKCTDLHFQDATVGVFHIRSAKGQYKLTFADANKTCEDESATVATYTQLLYAQKAKYHLCAAGWLANGRVAYPTAFSAPKCGGGVVGIIDYGIRVNMTETWDVFCYRVKDVNCTCKTGYVGDGFTCSGNLLQVLFTFPTFANFRSKIFTYSNTSRKGQEFMKYLTNLSIKATLFVPNNDGLRKNETLSGRDIEYHLTKNSTYYEDMVNGTTLQSRIGESLLITHQEENQEQISLTKKMTTKYVNGKAIREWDIIASNGVIHVIEASLKAPPASYASLHPGAGTGIFFAIILVIGIIAFVGYSYFRFKNRTIQFQLFREKDDIDVTTLDKAPSTNISNPNYESSSAPPPDPPYDPFLVSDEQQLVSSDSHNDF